MPGGDTHSPDTQAFEIQKAASMREFASYNSIQNQCDSLQPSHNIYTKMPARQNMLDLGGTGKLPGSNQAQVIAAANAKT